jgi:hypothetical protein
MIPHFRNFRKIEKSAPIIKIMAMIHNMFCSTIHPWVDFGRDYVQLVVRATTRRA